MKSDIKEKIDRLLSGANLKQTRPRVAILKTLLAASKPITQQQISKRLGSTSPNKVTIYRTLESFLKTGLVHRVYLRKRTWHFELAHNCTEKQCHPHFTCTSCGDTHCLTQIKPPMTKKLQTGFVIHRQQVRFEGLCPSCA